jgi:regulator of nonsense transcripts 3
VAFLERLTNPITKPTAPTDSEPEKPVDEEVTITPLVQFLKEKKASKAKESASAKSNKRGGKEKDSKAEKVETKKLLRKSDREGATDSTRASPEKKSNSAKIEEATKEAVKAARKQISASLAKQATGKEGRQTPEVTASTSERRRERGDVRAAAMILQRDLVLAPSGGRRRGKAGAAASTTKENEPGNAKEVKAETVTSAPATPTASNAPKGNSKSNRETTSKATGPPNKAKAPTPAPPTPSTPSTIPDSNTTVPAVADGLPSTSTNKASRAAKQAKPKPSPIISSAATQAFLKHANPSQGVTEELLDAAFNVFGKVLRVEIDKKKGFGYIDFAQAEGLQKAIAASPVTVAQSQVVVLERKNPPTQQGKAAAAKSTGEGVSEASSVASTQQPANASPGGGSQKRSRGPRSRGGRGKKGAGKTDTGDVASEN